MQRADARQLALLTLLCVPAFFWGLGRYGVVNADEAIYHGIAERMVQSGDWLHLDFRGEPRFYDSFLNAPLHYWARASLIALAGSSAWTMRVGSALAATGTVLVTAALAARLAGARAGLLAGLVLLTSFQFVYLHGARTGELDALVSLLFVSIAWLYARALEGRSFVPHHLALCALLWTKAPLVLVPLAVELGHFARRARRVRACARISWAVSRCCRWRSPGTRSSWRSGGRRCPRSPARSGTRPRARAPTATTSAASTTRPSICARSAGALFPWSAALPFAGVAALRDPRLRTWGVWPAALLAFFLGVAKHYAWYPMPAYPFFAIALGVWLAELRAATPLRIALAAGAIAAALVAIDATPPNPFAQVALTYPMQLGLRDPFGVPAWLAALLAAALVGGAALVAANRGPQARQVAASVLTALLFGAAALRTAAPLGQLDTRSEPERLHAALERARAEGRALAYPIRVPPGSVQIARFLFADDYEMEARATPMSGTALWLHPKGDPAVLDRSIGRLGLEKRLARGANAELPR